MPWEHEACNRRVESDEYGAENHGNQDRADCDLAQAPVQNGRIECDGHECESNSPPTESMSPVRSAVSESTPLRRTRAVTIPILLSTISKAPRIVHSQIEGSAEGSKRMPIPMKNKPRSTSRKGRTFAST